MQCSAQRYEVTIPCLEELSNPASPPAVAELRDIDSEEKLRNDIAPLSARIAHLDWECAYHVPWHEIVSSVHRQPFPQTDNEHALFLNTIAARGVFLNLIGAIVEKTLSTPQQLKEHLRKMNRVQLCREDGTSIYRSPTADAFLAGGSSIQDLAGEYNPFHARWHEWFFGRLLVEFQETFRSRLETSEIRTRAACTYYENSRLTLFKSGNNSLYLNILNASRRLHGDKGVSPGDLWRESRSSTRTEFIERFGL